MIINFYSSSIKPKKDGVYITSNYAGMGMMKYENGEWYCIIMGGTMNEVQWGLTQIQDDLFLWSDTPVIIHGMVK